MFKLALCFKFLRFTVKQKLQQPNIKLFKPTITILFLKLELFNQINILQLVMQQSFRVVVFFKLLIQLPLREQSSLLLIKFQLA